MDTRNIEWVKQTDPNKAPDSVKPGASATAEPPPKPDDLKKLAKEAAVAMGFGLPDDPPKVEPTPAAPATPAPAEPARQPQPEPEPEPEPEETVLDPRTAAAITATARAVADSMRPPAAPEPTPAPSQPALELSPEDAEDFRVIQWMARNDPDKHGNKPTQYTDWVRKHYAYAQKWIEDNDGKDYDPNDDEHSEWYASNPPPVSAKDIEEARIDMKVEERYRRTVEPEITMMKEEKAYAAHLPVMGANVDERTAQFIAMVDPELGKIVRPDGKKAIVTPETIAAVEAKDPIAKEVMNELYMSGLQAMLIELEKTVVPGTSYKLNPNNPVHSEIIRYTARAERELASAPSEQTRDGKQWLPIAELAKRQEAIANGPGNRASKEAKIAELNSRYWSLTVDDMEEVIIDDYAKLAKAKIAPRDRAAAAKYGSQAPAPASAPQPAAQPAAAPTPSAARKTAASYNPPSLSSSTDVVTSPQKGQSAEEKLGEAVVKSMFA